jgi:hypothetical protein
MVLGINRLTTKSVINANLAIFLRGFKVQYVVLGNMLLSIKEPSIKDKYI